MPPSSVLRVSGSASGARTTILWIRSGARNRWTSAFQRTSFVSARKSLFDEQFGFFEHAYLTTVFVVAQREYFACIRAPQTGQRSKPVAMYKHVLVFFLFA